MKVKVLVPLTPKEVVADLGITYQRVHYLMYRAKECPFNYLPNGLVIPDANYDAFKESLRIASNNSTKVNHEFVRSI